MTTFSPKLACKTRAANTPKTRNPFSGNRLLVLRLRAFAYADVPRLWCAGGVPRLRRERACVCTSNVRVKTRPRDLKLKL